jgi:hypothetical protein
MIVMDAHGMCRKGGDADGEEVAHDIGGTTLRMYARRVTRMDELDDPSLLEVPLPTPFGRHLVHAPVTWTCDGGGALTIKKLDELLGSLIQTRRREQSQSVTLQSYRTDDENVEEEEEEPPSASEDESADDDGEEEDEEEEEEEEEEEDEEDEEDEEEEDP